MKKILLPALIFLSASIYSQEKSTTSFEQWISLKQAGAVALSPDGKNIVYAVTGTDWNANAYDTELWMSREGGTPFRLTNTPNGSSNNASFSPNSQWVSFLADRGNKTQLYLISINGGEAIPATKDEDGISAYRWSPDGTKIAYTKPETDSKKDKSRKERYGGFGVEGDEFKLSHLWIMNFDLDSILNAGLVPCYTSKSDSLKKDNPCYIMPKAYRLTNGDFTVSGFEWSPDSKQIAFTKQPDPMINSGIHADIAIVNLSDKKITSIVSNPSSDFLSGWSPDGNAILYSSSLTDSISQYYKNNRLFIYDLPSKKSREILAGTDENKNAADWNPQGIFYTVMNKMKTGLYRFDPTSGKTSEIQTGMDIVNGAAFSKDGNRIVLNGRNFNGLNEIWYRSEAGNFATLTSHTTQLTGWKIPVNEIIRWKSKDGNEVEGVLLKPADYNPKKKYPLLVVIHGGPTGTDRPEPTPTYVYPIIQWCEKGALVLRVNYRGSAGYGEKFRALNVENMGVGDMWDVMSGVDFLARQNIIDTTRMGCMGWSQGGYISAFLTTNTNRFKAISVGAGISNWVTYYVNTDITPFTRQYLKSTPWDNMDIYRKTSPMTNISKASTPTLIQHGEFDRRVPIPNAYELYRGLQDRGIPSRLIVYKGFGHGINKPKERLAAVWHNWLWFNHYIWGEPMEDLPVGE